MPFPGWAPPLLTDDEARLGYEAGERIAVIAGDPADPVAGLVLDKRNARLSVRTAEPAMQLSYTGADLALAEALWMAGDHQCWARRTSATQLRVARRPRGAVVWTEELLAHAPDGASESVSWPEFGAWAELTETGPAPWVGEGRLELIDADGWILDAWESAELLTQWRELGHRYDAPRAFGLPPETQAKLAEPLGWHAVGRKWRKADEIAGTGGSSAVIVTDARLLRRRRRERRDHHDRHRRAGRDRPRPAFRDRTIGDEKRQASGFLPATLDRCPSSRHGHPGGRGRAHDAVVAAVRDGQLPRQWTSVFG